ncbi:unnamed protein product [Nippostrongylus brasiliensis]|uniref:Ig-like domain-containing protein n=1 Tax=Nippostrongylus brasiliensis TaxID=27835 RepID=A0A0N4XQJ4_NIPBR|nr:unnamed protein product [Nippostrongylus brasiliensis]
MVTVTAQEPAYLHCRIPHGSNHMQPGRLRATDPVD